MIEYVHRRLIVWGEWSMSRVDGGYQGGSQFSYREQMPGAPRSAEALSKILANSPALEMEMGMACVLKTEQRIGQILCDRYRDEPMLTAEALAESHRVCTRTFWNYIDRGHWMLLDWLNGRAIGEHDDQVREAWQRYIEHSPRIRSVTT